MGRVKNYRSHPGILMPPSAIFYNDTLEPCATNGVIHWSDLRNPELPLIFYGHEFQEECLDEVKISYDWRCIFSSFYLQRATWYNPKEIDKIVQIISSLLREGEKSSPPLKPAEIGVMAPWREQVWKLRERLRNEKLSAVDVGTVEVCTQCAVFIATVNDADCRTIKEEKVA
jgi:superfamily I DNA and/or RNA helicase